jgi:hypothetical protein
MAKEGQEELKHGESCKLESRIMMRHHYSISCFGGLFLNT